MSGVFKMIRLDFFTVKSQLRMSLFSFVLIIALFGFMGSSTAVLCMTGAWFVALAANNIFIIQEKCGLERLYSSVSVGLKNIISGRYLFVFLNYLFALLIATITSFGFELYRDHVLRIGDILFGFSSSFLIFSIISGVQMPVFFKMGYTKGRVFSAVPFVTLMALCIIPMLIPTLSLSVISAFIDKQETALALAGIVLGCIIQLISYQVSIICYRKRH